jgi:VIT1/CCC1 family predicted Fe2+/Mn2+ transporter
VLAIPTFFTEHLSADERLGELAFGLIMTLSFTLGTSVLNGTTEDAWSALFAATLGCNVAWGVIDGVFLILGRLFERGRLARLAHAIANARDEGTAVDVVAGELDPMLASISSDARRLALYRDIVERLRSTQRHVPSVTHEDFVAALATFTLVFMASLPVALPYLLIEDPWIALRVSNALLIGVLFYVGYRWGAYTSFNPWRAAVAVTSIGVVLVAIAIALGG